MPCAMRLPTSSSMGGLAPQMVIAQYAASRHGRFVHSGRRPLGHENRKMRILDGSSVLERPHEPYRRATYGQSPDRVNLWHRLRRRARVERRFLRGVSTKSDPDSLVSPPEILMGYVAQHLVICLSRIAADECSRPQVSCQYGI
jgi:hypothetical protein